MIFLDHNAGSPPDPRVAARVRELLDGPGFANPSSAHGWGRNGREIVEDSRERVARSLGVVPQRITFTSGATESNAAAIGHWARHSPGRKVVVASPIEHPSVLEPLKALARRGYEIRWAPVASHGVVETGWIEGVLDDSVAFAACMSANNETGALQPWREWTRICAERGIPLHVDATQSWGREPLDAGEVVGSVALSGHKIGALSGAGAICLSNSKGFHGLAGPGPQERGRRSGTESVLAVASLGVVAPVGSMAAVWEKWTSLREILWEAVADPRSSTRTVPAGSSLPNTLHLRIPIRAETAVLRLDLAGVAASAGSACASGSMRPSTTLLAMGWTESEASRGLRLSVGHAVDESQVRQAANILRGVLVG